MKSTIVVQLDIEHEGNIPPAVEFASEIAGYLIRPAAKITTRAKVVSAVVEGVEGRTPMFAEITGRGRWHAPDGHNAGRGSYGS